MLKNKRILLILIIAIALLLIPNIVNAKATQATETTKTSTKIDVKWEYELDSNNEIVALMCSNKADITGTLSIPSTIDGHTVKKLGKVNYDHTNKYYGDGTFEKSYGLQGVTIPNTVTVIGERAFDQCTGLKSITIPDNITSIGNYAYNGCTGVTTLEIGKGVTSIGAGAFSKCTGLKQLIIPNNVTNIGESAFRECSGITSLTLSNNISIINDRTFEGCTGLTSVKLPELVTTLKGSYSNIYGAFGGCSNLTKILIPDTVSTIEKGALRDCPKLTIYGNDGQVSKQYAEDNKIKFDYIANWDKASSGADITAPKVETMIIKYSSILNYWDKTTNTYRIPTGGKIQIIVTFSEDIKGTVPILKIKCGDSEERTIQSGVVSGKDIVYDYTIQQGDVGTIVAISYEGGNITDNSGNKAELSCKTLYVQYQSGTYAYANGTSANVPNETDKETNTNEPDEIDKGTDTDKPKDDTTKKDSKLPQTGIAFISIVGIAILGVAIISKVKYGKYKDIK